MKKSGVSYEGKQYTGGRVSGKKNLKKLPNGMIENDNGVKFTLDEKKRLEQLANSANRKRKKLLAAEDSLSPRAHELQLMGRESDFVLAKKTKSLQRFRSKKEYDRYIANLERVTKRDYVEKRVQQYKKNYIKALKNELGYGKSTKEIIEKIKNMTDAEYMKTVEGDEDMAISYVYSPQAKVNRRNQIRSVLGLDPTVRGRKKKDTTVKNSGSSSKVFTGWDSKQHDLK